MSGVDRKKKLIVKTSSRICDYYDKQILLSALRITAGITCFT